MVQNSGIYVYDGTFDGFLTVVFDIYASKCIPLQILRVHRWQPGLFDNVEVSSSTSVRVKTTDRAENAPTQHVTTDNTKSERVWKGFVTRAKKQASRMFYLAFMSEIPDVEMTLYAYLEKLFADNTCTYHKNLLDEHSYKIYQTARKVSFEIHRFQGFVRFQETTDGLLFAAIEPDHDIVALLAPFFARRYGNQQWVIYDSKRDKGVYYKKPEMHEITLSDKQFDSMTGEIAQTAKSENEDLYRSLWKAYYKAINIPERKNTRLMLRLLPRRYWKYLPEKN